MSSDHHEFDEAFLREARIGLMVLTVLVAIFLYVAYGKLSGWNMPEPVAFQSRDASDVTANGPAMIEAPKTPVPGSRVNPTNRWQTPATTGTADPPLTTPQLRSPTSQPLTPPAESRPDLPALQAPRVAAPERQQPPLPGQDAGSGRPATPRVPFSGRRGTDRPPNKAAIDEPSGKSARGSSGFGTASWSDGLRLAASRLGFGVPGDSSDERAAAPQDAAAGVARSVGSRPTQVSGFSVDADAKPANASSTVTAAFSSEVSGDDLPAVADRSSPGENVVSELIGDDRPAPAEEPFEKAVPLPANPGVVVVQEGEGFWMVAQKIYGDGRFFDALYQFNRHRVESFNDVPPGTELLTPESSELRRRWPYLCPPEEIRTLGGETLFEIAGHQLGQASRYVELLKLNHERLPAGICHDTPLPAGVTLELPKSR
jgi:hypothetical protein